MTLFIAKALHIIFVVTWFAGLFYIVRLFIYHVESEEKEEQEKKILQDQYKIMERRLWYGITVPSMIGALITGLYLAYIYGFFNQGWMHIKLTFVVGLIVYHHYCGKILKELKKDIVKHSSLKLRVVNEITTVFLISIVFIVVFKNSLDLMWGGIILGIFILLLLVGINYYKKKRKEKSP